MFFVLISIGFDWFRCYFVIQKHCNHIIFYCNENLSYLKCNESNFTYSEWKIAISLYPGLKDKINDYSNGKLSAENKKVVVIGGGDTAMDCVRTAVRQGAKSVKCIYRRDQKNMPGSQREVLNAIEEGIEFKWLSQPIEFIGDDTISKIKVVKMQLGSPDESGRRTSEMIPNSEELLDADLVIEALGFEPENLPKLFENNSLEITKWGTLKINFKNMMTTLEGVFAAGDIVRGASLVVWGIKDGRDAANNIHKYIQNKILESESDSIINTRAVND